MSSVTIVIVNPFTDIIYETIDIYIETSIDFMVF